MSAKKKAALPSQAGTLGKAAPTTGAKRTKNRRFRQRIKAIICWLGVRGVLPVVVVAWLLSLGGLRHD